MGIFKQTNNNKENKSEATSYHKPLKIADIYKEGIPLKQ